ncbi:hypothetical protein GCM10011521_22680 [Arenimonas soli]|uniref:histidine kinase n=1 Tax=Arenimonas soli TaxID=2269504 RepID=A0ABQ1HP15_9GAMM|nr:ATP-binding protein [Arenimonas soli]GGA83749.1 hypothetical protein GCM10011521_22680 [Arenimonas soli]
MPQRQANFRYRVFTGLMLFAVVVLAGTSLLSLRATEELEQTVERTSESQQLLQQVSAYWGQIGDSEAHGMRYLITGRAEFLNEYRSVLGELDASLKRLKAMTAVDPVASHLVEVLAIKNGDRLRYYSELHQLKAMTAQGNPAADLRVAQRLRAGTGARLLAEMQVMMDNLAAHEEARLVEHRAKRNEMIRQNWATVMVANALALAAGLVGFLATRRMQRQAQEAFRLELRAEQARQSSQDKSVFLASMSHEIRTPMNAIFGFTNLIAETPLDPRQATYVDSIRKSGQALLSLINDVLDLSKMEAGKLELREEATDLREIVDQTLTMFQQACADKGISLRADFDGRAELPVMVDPVRLRQVLINLVSNAVKYTETGGVVVRVGCHPSKTEDRCDLRIEVIDSGTGIPPHQLGVIFEPFEQGDSVDGKNREGTGLGLSIVRRLAELMGGELSAESTVGEGSVFRLDIPERVISTDSVSQQPERSQRIEFDLLPPLKVLVVDDVAWNRDLAVAYLAGSHHQVMQAGDGLVALEQLKAKGADIVLMDLRMPVLSGDQALQRIRANPRWRDIPVVALTASSMSEDENWVRARFDGYVRKPYSKADLFEALALHFPPRRDDAETTAPAPDVPAAPDPGPLRHDAEALAELKALRATLPAMRGNLRVREVAAAAGHLEGLAGRLDWPRLAGFARELKEAVDAFDVTSMRLLLANSPDPEANRDEH